MTYTAKFTPCSESYTITILLLLLLLYYYYYYYTTIITTVDRVDQSV
jgi:hypothetical protein